MADDGFLDATDYIICARITDLADTTYYSDEDSNDTFTTDINDQHYNSNVSCK